MSHHATNAEKVAVLRMGAEMVAFVPVGGSGARVVRAFFPGPIDEVRFTQGSRPCACDASPIERAAQAESNVRQLEYQTRKGILAVTGGYQGA